MMRTGYIGRIWVGLAMVALVGMEARGQVAVGGAASRPGEQPQRVVRMKVRPAATTRPALRYRLLPPVIEQTPGNAATLYFMAMTMAPKGQESRSDLFDEIAKLVSETPMEEFKAADAAAALGKLNGGYLKYVEMAARRKECDWGLTMDQEGVMAQLPHLSEMRPMASAVALDIRAAIAQRNYERAISQLQTGYGMVRHLNRDAVLIQTLVGASIASMMSQRVEELIAAPDSPNLYWALTDLPRPLLNLHDSMQQERYILEYTIPMLRSVRVDQITPEQFRELMQQWAGLQSMMGMDGKGDVFQQMGGAIAAIAMLPMAKAYVMEHEGLTQEQANATPPHQLVVRFLIGSYQVTWDEMLKWLGLPYWEALPGIERAEQQLRRAMASRSISPLATLISGYRPAVIRVALIDRQIASLRCVEAIRAYAATHGGKLPAKLEDMSETPAPVDPMTGKPFSYEVSGETAVIDVPAPAGNPKRLGWRYEVVMGK